MVNHSMRLTSFLLALFSFLLVFQHLMREQQKFPFHTTDRFVLNVSDTHAPKEEIIAKLDELAAHSHCVLVKVVDDSKEYENKKDVIWFGEEVPVPDNIIIKNNQVPWLDAEYTGNLISSKEMGSRPLQGTYAVQGTVEFRNGIEAWAEENDIILSWYIPEPFVKTIYRYLILFPDLFSNSMLSFIHTMPCFLHILPYILCTKLVQ